MKDRMEFLDLPAEMIEHIASFLSAKSLSCLNQTCQQLSNLDLVWQQLCWRDFKVANTTGWNLSFRDLYAKVLYRYGFFGLKRLALLPYGGLVHVCWSEGEIQVNGYKPQKRVTPDKGLICEPYFSLRWNESRKDVDIVCVQDHTTPAPAAVLAQCGKYPLLQCLGSHSSRDSRSGLEFEGFEPGFTDHPGVFSAFNLTKGFNCPMLPVTIAASSDQARSPIQLGLYKGDYSAHGIEILNLEIKEDNPNVLEGLKLLGDPNVPAGNVSVVIYLDQPIMLTQDQQQSIEDLQENDLERSEESFAELLGRSDRNMQQPFVVPPDCYERIKSYPKTCLARYLAHGCIAGHFFQSPTRCRCHFVKFSETMFGMLWLDLGSFSMFHKVEENFTPLISKPES